MKNKNTLSFFSLIIMGIIILSLSSCKKDEATKEITFGTMTDQDGNVYTTVTIGGQTWMAENLKATHYNDGTAIPNINDAAQWSNLTSGAMCDYDNSLSKANTYGKLYNWYAVNTGKLCPKGWHVASNDEWKTLINYLGGENVAGGKLKLDGTSYWNDPNTGATNESGFSALPGGSRSPNGTFVSINLMGYWWTSTENSSPEADSWYLNYNSESAMESIYNKVNGFSVRCVKD